VYASDFFAQDTGITYQDTLAHANNAFFLGRLFQMVKPDMVKLLFDTNFN
jgi:hypothetical protein